MLYRGSRDGFNASAFHTTCNGKNNTVTIILDDLNYVFGGYTALEWKSDYTYGNDIAAFIFSLRQNDINNGLKFKIRDSTTAIWNNPLTGPAFGSYIGYDYCDILVGYNADFSNYADFGASYALPNQFEFQDQNARSYLAGSFSSWNIAEIEVYQIIF